MAQFYYMRSAPSIKRISCMVPGFILVRLLHYANASPPWQRTEFYALKTRLLHTYAKFVGHDIQEIKKECWGDKWDDEGGQRYGCGPNCRRCQGTGIFSIRWIRLQKFRWGKYTFHCPDGVSYIKPHLVQINGLIEHANYGRASDEAALWLWLACGQWKDFCKAMRSSCCCGRYWHPLLNLQRICMKLCMYLRRQKCFYCKKWFTTWATGWQVCKRCRNAQDIQPAETDDIPF